MSGDAERRDRAAATLVRFRYRSLFELAAIQADPHPGNFIFLPDGRVAFLQWTDRAGRADRAIVNEPGGIGFGLG